MPFQPGNKLASNGKPFLAALKRAMAQDDSERIRQCAETLLDLAAAGEPWAVKELIDRLDGKAVQTVAADPENPFTFRIERVIVKPDA
jgi:hypothetical protein